MQLQNKIAREGNKKLIGKTLDVILDTKDRSNKNIWIGRSYMDAPDIDGVVYIHGQNLRIGDIIKAKITGASDYDLIAKQED